MKYIIILSIFILGIVFSGCTDSINNKEIDINSINDTVIIKNEQTKQFISENYEDIYFKLKSFDKACTKELTKLQCSNKIEENYVRNNINGHYVKWSGEIEDVGKEDYSMIVYVKISGFNKSKNYQWITGAKLYDIPKETLVELNKGDKILFTGKIMELDKGLGGITYNWQNLKLYDVEILEHDK